jgi:hypothetical protein
MVVFATLLGGTRRIKIAKAPVSEPMRAVKPVQHALDDVFGLTIGTSRNDAFIFGDWYFVGLIEQIRSGGEDNFSHTVLHHGF